MDHLGEKNLHLKQHDPHKPPMGCWCNGALNLGEVKWVKQLLPLVEERVEKVLDRKLKQLLNLSSLPHQAESSVSSSLQLRFQGKLPERMHTGNKIEEEGAKLVLELCNITGEKAEDISPELKNLRVKILPLVGDFKIEDKHDWTQEEFETHVAIPRDDKPPLLKGESEISLKNGFARIHGISFTDNSSYMRNGKFRLGAQLIKGLSSGGVVRPAVSEAFVVRVDRLKDQKPEIPSPHDELWRLDNIGKSGPKYQRAVKHKIFTVLDFLEQYYTDAAELQKILKLYGKRWKATVEKAEACQLSDELDIASGDHKTSQMAKVYKLRQAAHGKQKECKKVHTSTNQTPVHAGLGCPYPTEQLAAPPPPLSSMDYNVYGSWASTNLVGLPSNQICSTSTINTEYLDTAVTYQGNFEQLLASGAYGVNNPGFEHDNLVRQAADNSLCLQFDPAFDFSANIQFPNFTPENQDIRQVVNSADDDMQQGFNSSSTNDFALMVEELLADCSTNSSDQKLFNDSSANNPVTRKLVTVCYVTKAATIFMISAQQGPASPKKKRKLQ